MPDSEMTAISAAADPDDAWMLEKNESDSDDNSYTAGESDGSSTTSSIVPGENLSEVDNDPKDLARKIADAVGIVADCAEQAPGQRTAIIMRKEYVLAKEGQGQNPIRQVFVRFASTHPELAEILWLEKGAKRGRFFTANANTETSTIEFTEIAPKLVGEKLKVILDVKKRKDLKVAARSFLAAQDVPEMCFNSIFWPPDKMPQVAEEPKTEKKEVPKVANLSAAKPQPDAAGPPLVQPKSGACRRIDFDSEPSPKRAKLDSRLQQGVQALVNEAPQPEPTLPPAVANEIESLEVVLKLRPAGLSLFLPWFKQASQTGN